MADRPFDPFASMKGFSYTGNVRASYPLSPTPEIPKTIVRPNYAREGVSSAAVFWWQLFSSRTIRVNPKEDQDGVRKAAILAREVLMIAAAAIRPGITTDEIDQIVFDESIKRDCYPSPLGYHGYPKSVCTSVNEVICHGIPDQRPLEDGDIVNLDVTLYHHGFHGDLNGTWPVGDKGRANVDAMKLIKTARDCLDAAIARCGPGVPYAEIGRVIQPLAEANGCAVVKRYTGHGIGRVFHTAPTIYHHRTKKAFGVMKPGHVSLGPLSEDIREASADASFLPFQDLYASSITPDGQVQRYWHADLSLTPCSIEPMLNLGDNWKDLSWPDDWTVSTIDGAWSAAAEETLLITETGVEILTAEGGPRSLDTRLQVDEVLAESARREERKRPRDEGEQDTVGAAKSRTAESTSVSTR